MSYVIRSRTPEPPYCWQSKEALRSIRRHLDGDSLLPYAIAIYVALTENASDKTSETFTTLQGHLGMLAGNLSRRTVQRALPILREIGVIAYETPAMRGPISFRLLSVASNRRSVAPETKTTSEAHNRSNKEEQGNNKEEGVLNREIPEEEFLTFLTREYPHRVGEWTAANAPDRIIAEYHNEHQQTAVSSHE